MTIQRRMTETRARVIMVGFLLGALAALLAPGCGGEPIEGPTPDAGPPAETCTLTRAEQTGAATITSATASAPECEPLTVGLEGCTLSVVGGNVAEGVPFNVTSVREGNCVFALTGTATLTGGPTCTVTLGLAMTVRR